LSSDSTEALWKRFVQALEIQDESVAMNDSRPMRYESRTVKSGPLLQTLFQQTPARTWLGSSQRRRSGAPSIRCLSVERCANTARSLIVQIEHSAWEREGIANPYDFRIRRELPAAAPLLGEHSGEILKTWATRPKSELMESGSAT